MTEHGTFYWNELITRDVESARDFYCSMLGWTYDEFPMSRGGTYFVFKEQDQPVAGMFEMNEPHFEGVPPHWFCYVAVDDVDARVAAAEKAGGMLLRDIFDVPSVGRIAILQDPTGAAIGLMTPKEKA